MTHRNTCRARHASVAAERVAPRRGFTLVELLVVFSIIAVLAALLAAGIMSWVNSQSRRNTEAEIRTIYSALMQHWEAVAKDAMDDKTIPSGVMTMADNDAARARVIWVKLRLMEAFPVRFAEIDNPDTATDVVIYPAPLDNIPVKNRRYRQNYYLQLKGKVPTPRLSTDLNHPSRTESAACLLMALSTAHSGVSHPAELLRPYSRDTDNDGILELTDGWNEPLYFYRFATGNTELQASAPVNNRTPVNKDPRDPAGKLLNWSGTKADLFDQQVHVRQNTATTPTEAWYAAPLVVSAGPDSAKNALDPPAKKPNPPSLPPGLGITYSYVAPYQNAAVIDATLALDDLYSFKVK